MPVYEYSCNDCGPFQIEMGINEDKEGVVCAKCGGEDFRRVFSSSVITSSGGSGVSKEQLKPGRILDKYKKYGEAAGKKSSLVHKE